MGKNNTGMVQLVMRHEPKVVKIEGDIVTVELPISGLIEPKEGKDTHVILSGSIKVPRSDGKVVTIQANGWYK